MICLLVKENQIGYIFEPSDRASIVKFLSELTPEKREVFMGMGKRTSEIAVKKYAKEIILNKYVESI